MKRLLKKTNLAILLILGITACGSSGPKTPAEIDDAIKSGEYVKLTKNAANQITRGKDIFDTVMKKYQPVIDFYGADSEVFQSMVNTNLSAQTQGLSSPTDNMYNYDSMKIWEDSLIIVQYKDGTRESLPADVLIDKDGKLLSNLNDGKEIVDYFVELEKADEIGRKILNGYIKTYETCVKFQLIEPMNLGDVIETIQTFGKFAEICNTLVTIGQWAGGIGCAFNLVMSFIPGGDSADAILNKKLDYIIQALKAMFTHLNYIEDRLDQIELIIVQKAGKQVQLNLKNIINTVNGLTEELGNVPAFEDKKATALEFRNQINGLIQNYIDYSEADYDNLAEYQANYEKNPEYIPLQIKIKTPHKRHFKIRKTKEINIDSTLADFSFTNPNMQLPFTYEGLEFLKKLILTRLNINSFIYSDEINLNIYNSNTALTYINLKGSYIAKLKDEINNAYSYLNQQLKQVKDNISGPTTDVYTVKDNWNYCIAPLFNPIYTQATNWAQDYPISGAGDWGLADRWGYKPWISSLPPEYIIVIDLPGDDFTPRPQDIVTHSFPYQPSIVIETNEPIEFIKPITDVTFLDDTIPILDAYYKSKTNKLMEYAASLAALEIQLAMYLDDEDYQTYVNSIN